MSDDWLSQVPSGWEVRRPKTLFRERREPSRSDDVHLTPSQHHGVLPQTEYMRLTSSKVVLNLTGADNMKHVQADDFVIHLRSFQGGIEHSTYAGKVSNAYTVLAPSASVEPRYFRWVLKSSGYIQQLASSTDQLRDGQSIKYDQFARIPLPLPPLDVQRRIADFLDDQVRHVDDAIARRKRQMLLAEERVRSITTEEVSGGAAGAIKEATGNDWFPRIPAGWDLVTLGRLCSGVSDGPHFSPSYVDRGQGFMFLSARNVKIDRWSLDDAKYISAEDFAEFSKRVRPMIGDVLYTKGGTTGVARVVDLEEKFQVWVHVAVLKVRKNLALPEYIASALNSAPCYAQSQLFTRGATNNDLGLTRMVRIQLPLPPLEDQARIVGRLSDATRFSADFQDQAERQVRLLEERKRSLITAAVTGELDVTTASTRAADVALSGVGGAG